jgi:ElaB/YqjD/DUF883 family membrane-anchored ribosome-binding protein
MSDTPETIQALDAILREHGELHEDTAPAILVRLCKKLERELNAAKAQNADMKKLIRQIYYDTETYADGAPDASAHDKLCNEISSKLEPYLK